MKAEGPILNPTVVKEPVVIESIEVLEAGGFGIVRSRSTDGAVGVAITTERIRYLYPMLQQRVAPFFVGKDARQLESLVDQVYVTGSNYKLAGLAFWCCVAWVEISLLDMLGRVADLALGDLFGGVVRREIDIYLASGRRDTSPEEEVDLLVQGVADTGARAVKFKVGGRMSGNADSIPGRTEGLIPLSRRVLADDVAIHADANGSYEPVRAVEVGRMLEDIGARFFEEPCPFDQLEETKEVADALAIPIAGGEQEGSLRRFRWMIEHDAVQVVQPDVQYNGGFIRTLRVARLAEEAGMATTLHISGEPGFLYTLHFASCVQDIGPFQEYKGTRTIDPFFRSPLSAKGGRVTIPSGPGLGLADVEALLAEARPWNG